MTAILKEEPREPTIGRCGCIGARPGPSALPGEEAREALPVGSGPRLRPGDGLRDDGLRRRGGRSGRAALHPGVEVARRRGTRCGRGARRLLRSGRSGDGSRAELERGDDHAADDGSGLRRGADLLPRRTNDRLRLRPRRELRDLSAADRGRARAQSDEQPGGGHPAGHLSRRPRDRVRLESLEQLGHLSRGSRPAAHRRRHLGDARPRRSGPPDRRERRLPVLVAGRSEPPLRSRHFPKYADRRRSRSGRGEPRPADRRALRGPVFVPEPLGGRPVAALPERESGRGRPRRRRESEGPRSRRGAGMGARIDEHPVHKRHARQGPHALAGALFARAGRAFGTARAAHFRARSRPRGEGLARRNGGRVLRGGRESQPRGASVRCGGRSRDGTGPGADLRKQPRGILRPRPRRESGRLRGGPRRPGASLAHRSAGASGRAHARSELLGDVPRVVARRQRDRVFSIGRRSRRRRPGALDHEGGRHQPAAGHRLLRADGLVVGSEGHHSARRKPDAARSRFGRHRALGGSEAGRFFPSIAPVSGSHTRAARAAR